LYITDTSWQDLILEQFFHGDGGVVVPAPFLGFVPVLDRFGWAPLQTGKTELTLVAPVRLFVLKGDVSRRANAGTRTTPGAFFVCMEVAGTRLWF